MKFFLFNILTLAMLLLPLKDLQQMEFDHQSTAFVVDLQPVTDSLKSPSIESYFNDLCQYQKFNGNMLVAQNGKVLFKGTHGFEDYSSGDSLSYLSSFQLASVSKQFTAAAIMLLKERGVLSYADSVQQFIPDFPYHGITVRQLLTHRSGLPNYIYFCDHVCNRDSLVSNDNVLDLLKEHQPPIYRAPNRRFDYSNTGYFVLASIVEKISGKSFPSFMKYEFFDPLGMENTFVAHLGDTVQRKHVTKGYMRWRWKEIDPITPDGVYGDKGIYSSIEDMYIWDQALTRGWVLSETTLAEAFLPANKDLPHWRNYGFGWRLKTLDDGTDIVYHGGWWHGYNSLFVRIPELNATVIILGNRLNKCFLNSYQQIVTILKQKGADMAS